MSRNIECWIAVKEAHGTQPKAASIDRHYRPVFWPGKVDRAEAVPHHDVLAIDEPILRDELR